MIFGFCHIGPSLRQRSSAQLSPRESKQALHAYAFLRDPPSPLQLLDQRPAVAFASLLRLPSNSVARGKGEDRDRWE